MKDWLGKASSTGCQVGCWGLVLYLLAGSFVLDKLYPNRNDPSVEEQMQAARREQEQREHAQELREREKREQERRERRTRTLSELGFTGLYFENREELMQYLADEEICQEIEWERRQW